MDEARRYESSSKLSNILDKPQWKSQTVQTFFQSIDVKYFAVINKDSSSSNSNKMNLLNQMLKSIKFKDKELRLKRDIIKENKEKMKNLS